MLISFVFGFLCGITTGSVVSISIGFIVALVISALILFGYKFFIEENSRYILLLAFVFMVGIVFGVGRMYVSDLYTESELSRFANQKIWAEGIIVSEPDVRENNTKLTIGLRSIFVGTTTVAVREKIVVTVPIHPEFRYGDKVKISATLKEPTKIKSEDGRTFDYGGYLRVRGVWFTSSYTTVDLISNGHGSVVKSSLFKIKKTFTESLDNALPEPESSLLSGLLLGAKQSLGKEILEEFQKTGVSHIVVLSGYNIAIVANSIMNFFRFLPKNLSFGLGAVGIVFFTILSGGGASAWRASIMVLVALFAKRMNRDYKIGRVLGFTIVLMLAPNPLLLAFDPSFQLSVLATIGLIFVSPYVSPYLVWITEKFGLREIVSSTIATQITVLPYLIYNMGVLSLVSLPVNVLILGTIPLAMFLGFATGIAGFLSLYISYIPAFFTYILLWYQLTVVHIGANIPFGAISLPDIYIFVLK
ncbi:MAG: internalization-related competence protein ComEC/Rec2 protein [Parcubacteria group bacterium GW2011_GWF1_39_37]|nr:MAG: internalization-related competence protein ComEC/Rec2 protein [Parcubacteria group bacterium GW2011_GWF1_39_37]